MRFKAYVRKKEEGEECGGRSQGVGSQGSPGPSPACRSAARHSVDGLAASVTCSWGAAGESTELRNVALFLWEYVAGDARWRT